MPFENYTYRIDKCFDIELDESILNINVYFSNYNSNKIIFSQNSLKTPYSLYQFDLDSKEYKLLELNLCLIIIEIITKQNGLKQQVMMVLLYQFQ